MCDCARAVDVVDHRGERRRLARAGRAGDEHEPAVLLARAMRTPCGRPRSSNRGTFFGITRSAKLTAPRCRKALTRNRGRSPDGVGDVEIAGLVEEVVALRRDRRHRAQVRVEIRVRSAARCPRAARRRRRGGPSAAGRASGGCRTRRRRPHAAGGRRDPSRPRCRQDAAVFFRCGRALRAPAAGSGRGRAARPAPTSSAEQQPLDAAPDEAGVRASCQEARGQRSKAPASAATRRGAAARARPRPRLS